MKKKTLLIILLFLILVSIISTILYFSFKSKEITQVQNNEEIEIIPELYGLKINEWNIITDTVRKGDCLGNILSKYNVSVKQIDQINKMVNDTFKITLINIGRVFTIFTDTVSNDTIIKAKIFVYENNKYKYTKFDFRNKDTVFVERYYKQVDTIIKSGSGIIKTSLWHTMIDNGYSWQLAIALSKIFAGTVDFYSLQPGNWFKILYEELHIEGAQVGVGNIQAGVFFQGGKELWAVPFCIDSTQNFYDTLGNSMKRQFLTAPLEFTHISSRYSNARMHPIFHKVTEHLAVDFSAPMGTPVYAAADGVITIRRYGTGAGNYVAIKHNSTYTTVYMHFSEYGIYNVGDRVKQGDIIGYVGSTGWSTGPHLHYEVHENGKKIDPLTFSPPPAEPVDSINMPRFNKEKQKWIKKINKIKLNTNDSII